MAVIPPDGGQTQPASARPPSTPVADTRSAFQRVWDRFWTAIGFSNVPFNQDITGDQVGQFQPVMNFDMDDPFDAAGDAGIQTAGDAGIQNGLTDDVGDDVGDDTR